MAGPGSACTPSPGRVWPTTDRDWPALPPGIPGEEHGIPESLIAGQ